MTIPHQLKVLFSTFPPQPGDLAAQIEAYGIALEGHDPRDIEAAVRRFIRGEVDGHNQSFPPTASKLGGVVRQCLAERLDSEHRARMAQPQLPPPDIEKTTEGRQRVRALTEKAIKDLSEKMLTPDARRSHRFTAGDRDGHEDAA
jgi:hypothetical protein